MVWNFRTEWMERDVRLVWRIWVQWLVRAFGNERLVWDLCLVWQLRTERLEWTFRHQWLVWDVGLVRKFGSE
jgi:hypothetical protein